MPYLSDLHPQAVVLCLQALQTRCACLVHAGDRGGRFGIFLLLILCELEPSVLSGSIRVCSERDELEGHRGRWGVGDDPSLPSTQLHHTGVTCHGRHSSEGASWSQDWLCHLLSWDLGTHPISFLLSHPGISSPASRCPSYVFLTLRSSPFYLCHHDPHWPPLWKRNFEGTIGRNRVLKALLLLESQRI